LPAMVGMNHRIGGLIGHHRLVTNLKPNSQKWPGTDDFVVVFGNKDRNILCVWVVDVLPAKPLGTSFSVPNPSVEPEKAIQIRRLVGPNRVLFGGRGSGV